MLGGPPSGPGCPPLQREKRLTPGGAQTRPWEVLRGTVCWRKAWLNVNMPDSNLSLIASPSLPQAPRLLSILAHSSVSHRTAGGLGCRQGRPPAAPLVHGAGGRGWRPLPGGKRGMPGDRQLERGKQRLPGGRWQAGWRPLPGEFRGQRAWRACGSRLRTNTAESRCARGWNRLRRPTGRTGPPAAHTPARNGTASRAAGRAWLVAPVPPRGRPAPGRVFCFRRCRVTPVPRTREHTGGMTAPNVL